MPLFLLNRLAWRPTTLALAIVTLTACGQSAPAPEIKSARPAYVTEVRAADMTTLAYTGEVRATQRAELAFPVSGRVAQVLVEPGDAVRQGQALALLDMRPIQAQLTRANAELARAQAQLSEVRRRMARLEIARDADAISAAETTATQTELASADTEVRAAQAQRDLAAWSLEQATLRAPLDGVVASRSIEPGQTTGPGGPALVLDGAGRELALQLPADQTLKVGQTISLRNQSVTLRSKVLRVAGRLDAGGVRKVYLSVPGDAPVGSTWSALLDSGTAEHLLSVPLRAVLPGNDAATGSVLRVTKDGHSTERVPLKLGNPHGEWIDIIGGLAPGDRVVVAGAAAITPGTAIKPIMLSQLESRP